MSDNSAKIRVTAQDDTKSGLDSAKRNFAGLKSGVADAADGIDGFRTAVSGAVAALGVTAFAGWVKGAIDSADALSDLSEQTGIAAGKLSEYQYAAQMSGTSLDTLSTGFKELAKGIASNDDALKSMGVATRDAAGNLRGTDQVLEDVAEKFAGYEDGAAKSALAMQLFGKAGQEMIPFLNNGKAGLEAFADRANRLHIVLSEDVVAAAAKFNDRLDDLKFAGSSYASQLAGQLLPTLNVVSESLLGTATDSGVLKDATSAIAVGLKGLVSVGYTVATAFADIRGGFGALAAAAGEALRGNWARAAQIVSEESDKIGDRQEALAGKFEKIWSDVPPAVEKSASDAAGKALRAQAPVVAKAKENATATKSAYDTLLESMRKQLQQTEKLTATEKLSQELAQKKYATLSQGQREHLQSIAEEIDSSKRLQQQAEATAKWLDDSRTAQNKTLQDLQAEYKKAKEEVENYGLSRGQIAERDLRLLQEQIDAERALNAEIGVGGSQYLSHLEQQLALRQQIVVETEKLDTLDAGKKAAEEAAGAFAKTAEAAQKTNDAITQGLTDALMRSFENGKGFAENLRDTTVNMFKTMVLTPAIKAVVDPVAMAAQQAVGRGMSWAGGAAGAAAGAGVNYLTGGSLAAAGGWAGLGEAFTAGSNLTAAEAAAAAQAYSSAGMSGTATAIQAGQYAGSAGITGTGGASAAGAGTAGGSGGSSAMAGAGWAAAIVAAIYTGFEWQKRGWFNDNSSEGYAKELGEILVKGHSQYDRLFGINRNTSFDATGIEGSLTAEGFTGRSWQDKSRKGGTFRSDERWTDYGDVSQQMVDGISREAQLLTSASKNLAKVMGEDISAGLKSWKYDFALQLSENGDLSKAGEKLAGEILKASDSLALHLFPSLEQLALQGESTSQTLARLSSVFDVTNASALLLGRSWQDAFGGIGIASAAARQQLVDMSGGVEALQNKLGGYYESYFSQTEKNQRSLELLDAQFAAMGVRLDLSKESFRGYLEDSTKVDLATESGRKLYAAMLDLAGPFSQLVDSLGDAADGKTIGSLASLMGEKSPIAESVKEAAADWWSQYGTAVEDQADQAAQIKAGLDNMAAAFASMQDALLTAMQQTQSAALLSNTQSAASVANVIEVGINRMTGVVEGALSSGNRW